MHVDIYGTSRLENAGQCISHTKGLKTEKKKRSSSTGLGLSFELCISYVMVVQIALKITSVFSVHIDMLFKYFVVVFISFILSL